MQNPAPGSSNELHLNYSTTNINKTHIMSLGVVLQLGESLPQTSIVRNWQYSYGTLRCQIVVTLVCFTVQRQIIMFSVFWRHASARFSSSVVNCRLRFALQHSWVSCTVNSLSFFLIMFQNWFFNIPEGWHFFSTEGTPLNFCFHGKPGCFNSIPCLLLSGFQWCTHVSRQWPSHTVSLNFLHNTARTEWPPTYTVVCMDQSAVSEPTWHTFYGILCQNAM